MTISSKMAIIAAMNYPGGKGGIYQKIINQIPPHEVYIETHLGGGAVLRNKKPAAKNIGLDIDPHVISMWKEESLNNIEVKLCDALTFLQKFKFTGKEFVYCDPPYLRETRRKKQKLYRYEYTDRQHVELLDVLKKLPCMVMISGYESNLYSESLKKWNTLSFQAKTRQGMATEWLWMNYVPPTQLHDYRYLGENFRERERIQRKKKRWTEKLSKMPLLERRALLAVLHEL